MDRLLKIDEVAERLNVAVPTIYGWVHRRRIRFIKLAGGTLLRFKTADIDEMVSDGLHEPEDVTVDILP